MDNDKHFNESGVVGMRVLFWAAGVILAEALEVKKNLKNGCKYNFGKVYAVFGSGGKSIQVLCFIKITNTTIQCLSKCTRPTTFDHWCS